MKLRLFVPAAALLLATYATAQAPSPFEHQPPGVAEALGSLSSLPATHSAVTFDRDMIQGFLPDPKAVAALNSITFENYSFGQPAFYIPEEMHALVDAYNAAGWHHLIMSNVTPGQAASPQQPITDMWLHFRGADIDGCTVLIRAQKQMSVIEVSGVFRPLDLVHLGGHFGIPKVDPNAVMVPAPPGR